MIPLDEKDVQLLSDILPSISAQLRSSMANVFAAANRIASPDAREKDPSLDQSAAILTKSCHQILRLTGNLSTMSDLFQSGKLPLHNGDIVEFTHALCTRAEALFALSGVTLTFRADRESHIVAFHGPMLERALLNLLSNALKFTPSGKSVTVRVRCCERSVQLIVSDKGRGIEPERLSHIFEHTPAADTAPPHGLGVGLSLCRYIAQIHGGLLLAESTVGKGSVFTLTLPNTRVPEAELHEQRFDYAGGFDHVLMELSDALPSAAFLQKYLD